ncbi:FitA-like ribbon-helix-helix domain-containing protein [Azohydromonas sediminis]|uniref:FitA-like ribbon-helix-helix domain-containing protein n=1 Tax=Azohydromonas sediminis TaxID=2259674 RepID=UPI000E649B17|nr:plasmid stabilization protein [Azohydromonas sediminis]
MPVLTIRDLPGAVLCALRQRAARHGRSLEAEVRAILEAAVRNERPSNLGSLLANVAREVQLTDEDVALLHQRDRSLPRVVTWE